MKNQTKTTKERILDIFIYVVVYPIALPFVIIYYIFFKWPDEPMRVWGWLRLGVLFGPEFLKAHKSDLYQYAKHIELKQILDNVKSLNLPLGFELLIGFSILALVFYMLFTGFNMILGEYHGRIVSNHNLTGGESEFEDNEYKNITDALETREHRLFVAGTNDEKLKILSETNFMSNESLRNIPDSNKEYKKAMKLLDIELGFTYGNLKYDKLKEYFSKK